MSGQFVQDGSLDLADIDFSQPSLHNFVIEEDTSEFNAADKDDDANG